MATTRRNTISLDHKILYVPSAKYAKIEAERSESKYTALSAQSSEERSFVPISRNGSIKSNALSRQNSIDNSRNSSRPSSTKRRSVQDINHSANPPSIQVNQSRNVLAKGASASNLLGTCQSSNTSTTAVTQLPVVNADNIPQSVKEEIDKYINFSVYSIPVYTLDPTLVELEKKIIVDAASNMKYRSGMNIYIITLRNKSICCNISIQSYEIRYYIGKFSRKFTQKEDVCVTERTRK
jgi:ribosomal protein L30E